MFRSNSTQLWRLTVLASALLMQTALAVEEASREEPASSKPSAEVERILSDPHKKLTVWIHQNGGNVDMEVGPVNEEGLRGAKAMRNMVAGQVAVKLPRACTAPMGAWNKTSEENALVLLERKAKDKNWDLAMGPYWDALPKQGDFTTKETFPPEALPLLQDEAMAAFVRVHQDYTRSILRGAKPHILKDARELLGRPLSLAEFTYWTALVASYAYTFPDERDPDSQIRILLPMIDMINHADPERANIKVFRDDKGNYMAYATRPIKKGEELVHTYNTALERNDHSLFHYGFVQDTDPPKLAAQDILGGDLYADTLYSEKDYEAGGTMATQDELDRLSAILAAYPTTEAQDLRLLEGGSWLDGMLGRKPLTGEVERLFVKFRMLRKRALRHTIDKLKAVLAAAKAEL